MNRSKQMQECIEHCVSCYQGCTEGIDHCLSKGGKHAEPSHIKLMLETAQMCNMNASFMLMNAQYTKEHCHLCAKVCASCAEACGKLGDDPKMRQMSEQLQKCAESCRSM